MEGLEKCVWIQYGFYDWHNEVMIMVHKMKNVSVTLVDENDVNEWKRLNSLIKKSNSDEEIDKLQEKRSGMEDERSFELGDVSRISGMEVVDIEGN